MSIACPSSPSSAEGKKNRRDRCKIDVRPSSFLQRAFRTGIALAGTRVTRVIERGRTPRNNPGSLACHAPAFGCRYRDRRSAGMRRTGAGPAVFLSTCRPSPGAGALAGRRAVGPPHPLPLAPDSGPAEPRAQRLVYAGCGFGQTACGNRSRTGLAPDGTITIRRRGSGEAEAMPRAPPATTRGRPRTRSRSNTIVVTASRAPQQISETARTIYVVEGEAIAAQARAGQSLQTILGQRIPSFDAASRGAAHRLRPEPARPHGPDSSSTASRSTRLAACRASSTRSTPSTSSASRSCRARPPFTAATPPAASST